MKKFFAFTLFVIFLSLSVISGATAESNTNRNQSVNTDGFSVDEMNFDTRTETIKEFENIYTETLNEIEIQDSGVSTFSIIGNDDRTPVENTSEYPYSAIVLLEIKWGLFTKNYATAFMVSDNVAITSAHALYNKDKGWPLSIKAYPAKDGYGILSNPYGSSSVTAAGVCTQWREYIDNSSVNNPTYPQEDWGAVVLKKPLGEETGTISIKCPTNDELTEILYNRTVKVCGYYNESEYLANYHQYEMSGNITGYSDELIYYDIDTYGGQSGSPILNDDNVAIGIHFGGIGNNNCAVRMDENMMYYFNLTIDENR